MLGSQEAVGNCDPFELPDDFLMVEKVSQILPGALSMIYLYKARKLILKKSSGSFRKIILLLLTAYLQSYFSL